MFLILNLARSDKTVHFKSNFALAMIPQGL